MPNCRAEAGGVAIGPVAKASIPPRVVPKALARTNHVPRPPSTRNRMACWFDLTSTTSDCSSNHLAASVVAVPAWNIDRTSLLKESLRCRTSTGTSAREQGKPSTSHSRAGSDGALLDGSDPCSVVGEAVPDELFCDSSSELEQAATTRRTTNRISDTLRSEFKAVPRQTVHRSRLTQPTQPG